MSGDKTTSDEAFVFAEVYRVTFKQTHDEYKSREAAKTAVLAFRNT